jgi:alcohol dehydrogenase
MTLGHEFMGIVEETGSGVTQLKGASRVIGIDIQPYRLETARRTANSETLDAAEKKEIEVVQAIRDMTGGRGADICVDAVGLECDRSLLDKAKNVLHGEVGSIKALRTAISAVRRGGWVTVTGVYSVCPTITFRSARSSTKASKCVSAQARRNATSTS